MELKNKLLTESLENGKTVYIVNMEELQHLIITGGSILLIIGIIYYIYQVSKEVKKDEEIE